MTCSLVANAWRSRISSLLELHISFLLFVIGASIVPLNIRQALGSLGLSHLSDPEQRSTVNRSCRSTELEKGSPSLLRSVCQQYPLPTSTEDQIIHFLGQDNRAGLSGRYTISNKKPKRYKQSVLCYTQFGVKQRQELCQKANTLCYSVVLETSQLIL